MSLPKSAKTNFRVDCPLGVNCIFMRYIELRLLINMYVGSIFVLVCFIVSCMALSLALSIFFSLGSLYAN
jgi:hypothetical protein